MKCELDTNCGVFVYIETVSTISNERTCSFLDYLSSLRLNANSIINKISPDADFICTIQIRSKSLCIKPISAHRIAEYPLRYISTVNVIDNDDNYFYVITPSKTKRIIDNKSVYGDLGKSYVFNEN